MKLEQLYGKEAFSPFFGKDWVLICDLANLFDADTLEQKWGEDYFEVLEGHGESVYKLKDYFTGILAGQGESISNGALAEIMKFMAYLFKEAYYDYNAGIGDATPTCEWFANIRENIRPYAAQVESYLGHGDLALRLAAHRLIEEWKKAEHFIVKDRKGFPSIVFSK